MKITVKSLRGCRNSRRSRRSPAELAARLTLAGLEVESIQPVAPPFSGVVVGEVLRVRATSGGGQVVGVRGHDRRGAERSAADHLRRTERARGLKVAVATVGARAAGRRADQAREAPRSRVERHAVLGARARVSARSTTASWSCRCAVGWIRMCAKRWIWTIAVLEVNATPNRGDCMSVFGIARDYAAAQERRYLRRKRRAGGRGATTRVFPVRIGIGGRLSRVRLARDPRACARVRSSPAWLKERLRRVGLNSISPVVDVTNYVMTELGQPMHAYDLARLDQGIVVRAATPGERITLLDGKEYELDPRVHGHRGCRGAVGLAGIMGGRRTSISDSTSDVLLESAHFTPDTVAGRARRLGLFTDAAQRFERGVDPALPQIAMQRATALLLEIAGGQPGPRQVTAKCVGRDDATEWVSLRRSRLARLLGADVPDGDVRAVLAAISEQRRIADAGLAGAAPAASLRHPHRGRLDRGGGAPARLRQHWRGSCHRPADRGLCHRSRACPGSVCSPPWRTLAIAKRSRTPSSIRRCSDSCFPRPRPSRYRIRSRRSSREMRVSLWPGLIAACRENMRRQHGRVRLFEIGSRFDVDGRRACARSNRSRGSRPERAGRSNGAVRASRWIFTT